MKNEKIIYEVLDNDMLLLASSNISNIKHNKKSNRDFLKNLNKRFFEEKEDRITQINKVLNFYGLPLDIFNIESLRKIDKWAKENVEHNNISLTNDDHNAQLTSEHAATKIKPNNFLPTREATQLWKSYLFDIGIKMGEEAIQQYPNLYWEMIGKGYGSGSLNLLSLRGLNKEEFKGEFINVLGFSSMYLDNIIRGKTPYLYETYLIAIYQLLNKKA